jgi:hypothetical protein
MSFTFAAAKNTSVDRNFKIAMTFTVNSVEKTVEYLFDVVLNPLSITVVDEDLYQRLKDLRDMSRYQSMTTAEGTTTTIVDAALTADRRDWTGGRGTLIFDSAADQEFVVTAFDDSMTLTIRPAYSVNVPAGTKYIMRMSYQDQIDNAFFYVMRRIRTVVGPLAGYIDTNTINDLVIYRALSQICLGEVEVPDDKWDYRRKEYENEFSTAFAQFQEAYDKDGDGNISDEEQANPPSFGTARLER